MNQLTKKTSFVQSLGRLATTTLAAIAAAFAAGGAAAAPVSGGNGLLSWEASSYIIGQTSTATVAAGGNPIYNPPMPQYSGVASLIMRYASGSFICTGSLMEDRATILTAAHCVASDASDPLLSVTAYFNDGPNRDVVVHADPTSTAMAVSNIFIHPDYTGEVIDQNDIAVLNLSTWAPSWVTTYGLSLDNDLTRDGFTVAGYGGRSSIGGAFGTDLGTGRLRYGDNRYDFRLGDAAFGGQWNSVLQDPGDTAAIDYVYLSDFDNGRAANDTSCRVAVLGFGLAPTSQFCNTGVGAREVGVAGGDSGGPQFDAAMRVTSVTSFGLTFIPFFGDFRAGLNSSWGEFSGYVPVHIHRDFITSHFIPEPGSIALLGLAGGLLVLTLRRRRQSIVKH